MNCGCENKREIFPNCDMSRWEVQCSSYIEDADNYYTKPQIDEMLEEIESAITSGCCITPEQVDEKIDEAVSGKVNSSDAVTSVTVSDYNNTVYVNYYKGGVGNGYIVYRVGSGLTLGDRPTYVLSVDTNIVALKSDIPSLSGYVTFEDMAEYVGDIYTKEEVNNLFVTKQYFTANTISRDTFITTIYNLNQEINSLKAAISACCGSTGETEYRWIVVPNDYTCSGTTKMTKEKQQSSVDGINWTDTGQYRTGSTVLEYNSVDCGYVPVATYKVEMRYNDGTEDDRQCDGSSNLRWLNPSNWENISGVTVGDCIDEIGNLCFNGFSGLTSVSLPSTITKINVMAFSDCISLSSITIPSGVTTIGSQAFTGDKSLTSVTIPNGVTVLEYATFFKCESLASVVLSENLEKLGEDVFKFSGLQSITIPSGVTEIGQYCFAFNHSLTSATINAVTPPTLQNDNIFYGSDRLTAIYVPAASVNAYKSASGWSTYANRIQAIP